MPSPDPSWVVVSDANVLINLMHAGRLDLLAALTPFEFIVPDHVIAEITVPAQRQMLELENQELKDAQIVVHGDIHAGTTVTVFQGKLTLPET
ncbi:MAG: hypothetical protein QW390_00195, partial [Candidatus Bathyarchaeia archaeon]